MELAWFASIPLDKRVRRELICHTHRMNGMNIALISFACIFGGTLLGLGVRRMLPADHLREDSKDAVKVGAGMISMMAALVLGLLVSSAKSTFDSATAALTQGSAKIILMDRLLAQYGPETKEVRESLRQSVATGLKMIWPEQGSPEPDLRAFERNIPMEGLLERMRALKPQTETQRDLLARAQDLAHDVLLSRWLQIEQAQIALPRPFLVILLFWLTLLYTSFGLLAPRNATVITTMFLGALALATAMFLIVEMSHPLSGAMKVSSGPLHKALEHLGR
jgi:hypothetical protein